jgi:hypothetical protein
VNPHLPASWNEAEVRGLQLAGETTSLYFLKKADHLEIYMSPTEKDEWRLRSDLASASLGPIDVEAARRLHITPHQGLRIPLPPLQVDNVDPTMNLVESVRTATPNSPPLPGSRTEKFRILHSDYGDHWLTLTVEGLAGSDGILRVVRNGNSVPKIGEGSNDGNASLSFRSCDANPLGCTWYPLTFSFPPGEGWKTITVALTW